jgi:hypothetical protein
MSRDGRRLQQDAVHIHNQRRKRNEQRQLTWLSKDVSCTVAPLLNATFLPRNASHMQSAARLHRIVVRHLNTSPNTFLCGTPAALMRATPATRAV